MALDKLVTALDAADIAFAATGDTAAYKASIKAAEFAARLASKRYARNKAMADLSESPLFGGAKQQILLGLDESEGR